MAYNILDIIDKGINIARKRKLIYEDIGHQKCDIPSMHIMSKVLVKETDKVIQYYEKLKNEITEEEIEEIDIGIYDKMSFLLNEFNKRLYAPEIGDVREFLGFFIKLEKDMHALLLDLQGRYVKNEKDIYTKTYKVLSDIISTKAAHIATMEKTIKKQ